MSNSKMHEWFYLLNNQLYFENFGLIKDIWKWILSINSENHQTSGLWGAMSIKIKSVLVINFISFNIRNSANFSIVWFSNKNGTDCFSISSELIFSIILLYILIIILLRSEVVSFENSDSWRDQLPSLIFKVSKRLSSSISSSISLVQHCFCSFSLWVLNRLNLFLFSYCCYGLFCLYFEVSLLRWLNKLHPSFLSIIFHFNLNLNYRSVLPLNFLSFYIGSNWNRSV